MMLVVASTALAAVAVGVSIQFFRPQSGTAAEGEAAGSAKLGAAAAGAGSGSPMARVGDIVITQDMVAAECLDRYKNEVLEKMINRAIIEQACRDRGVSVSNQEVAAEIGEISKKFQLDPGQWLKMLQVERGISPEQYSRDIIWPMLALKKMAGSDVTITEEDMAKAFQRNYGPRVECKIIMLDNVRRANDVWKQAQENPEEFGRLARENSIEPTSRALDGDVPPIRAYSGNENLERVAFKLKKGEVSGITEIGTPEQKRYVIMYCKGRTQQIAKMEDVRKDLYASLQEEKQQEAVGKVFEDIRGKTKVINYTNNTVAGPNSDGGIQKASAYGVPTQPKATNALPPQRTTSGSRSVPR
jgi:foldase protein PrsA